MIPRPTIQTLEATPDFVIREIIPANTYPGQRPKSDAKRKAIEQLIQQKRFLHAQFATCDFRDVRWLMNGQHTADAIKNTGIAVQAVWSHYVFPEGATLADVGHLFMQFDATPCRTKSDKGRAALAGAGDEMPVWPGNFIKLLVDAFAFLVDSGRNLEWNLNGRRKDVDLCAMHLNSNFHESRFVYSVLYNSNGNQHRIPHMVHPGVIAAMMTTWQVAANVAIQFWTNVRAGEGLSIEDPEYILREYLCDLATRKWRTRGREYVTHKIDPVIVYTACVKAWNATRRNKRLSGLSKLPSQEVPFPE